MTTLETPEFVLTLEDDWIRLGSDVADRHLFESVLRDTSLTIVVEPMLTPGDDLQALARKLADHRIEGHLTAAQTHGWLFEMTEPQIIAREFGQVVSYEGRLLAGGRFAFTGLVLTTGVVNLLVESDTASQQALSEALSEVASGMEIEPGLHG